MGFTTTAFAYLGEFVYFNKARTRGFNAFSVGLAADAADGSAVYRIGALDAYLENGTGRDRGAVRRGHEHARVGRLTDEQTHELGADRRLIAWMKR